MTMILTVKPKEPGWYWHKPSEQWHWSPIYINEDGGVDYFASDMSTGSNEEVAGKFIPLEPPDD